MKRKRPPLIREISVPRYERPRVTFTEGTPPRETILIPVIPRAEEMPPGGEAGAPAEEPMTVEVKEAERTRCTIRHLITVRGGKRPIRLEKPVIGLPEVTHTITKKSEDQEKITYEHFAQRMPHLEGTATRGQPISSTVIARFVDAAGQEAQAILWTDFNPVSILEIKELQKSFISIRKVRIRVTLIGAGSPQLSTTFDEEGEPYSTINLLYQWLDEHRRADPCVEFGSVEITILERDPELEEMIPPEAIPRDVFWQAPELKKRKKKER